MLLDKYAREWEQTSLRSSQPEKGTSFTACCKRNQDYQTRACGLVLIEAAPAGDGLMEQTQIIKPGETGNQTTMEETKTVSKCTEEEAMLEGGMIIPAPTMEHPPPPFARSPGYSCEPYSYTEVTDVLVSKIKIFVRGLSSFSTWSMLSQLKIKVVLATYSGDLYCVAL